MKSKVRCHLKLPNSHLHDAAFRGERFFAAWDWARLRLLPELHCSTRPQQCSAKKLRLRRGSEPVMPLCSGLQRRSRYSRPIFGSNTTNSAASRTARFQEEPGMKPTPKPLRYSTRTCRYISTTTPMMKSPITGVVVDIYRHRSEEHTSELQSRLHLVCRLLLEKKKKTHDT